MNSKTRGKKFFSPLYAKLNQDGTPSSDLLNAADYDSLVSFMKFTFPKSFKIHQNFDESMKRTFVLGKQDVKITKVSKRPTKAARLAGIRKKRFRVSRTVPRNAKYSNFLELNSLWNAYVNDVIRDDTKIADIQQKLNRIDMHGANIKLTQSNCDSLEKLEGIVIKETKNTFVIVTPGNETKTLPKCQNVFEVIIRDRGILEIAGTSFISRPAERTSKKIKSFIEYLGPKVYRRQLLNIL